MFLLVSPLSHPNHHLARGRAENESCFKKVRVWTKVFSQQKKSCVIGQIWCEIGVLKKKNNRPHNSLAIEVQTKPSWEQKDLKRNKNIMFTCRLAQSNKKLQLL